MTVRPTSAAAAAVALNAPASGAHNPQSRSPLFQSNETLAVTLEAPFDTLSHQRDEALAKVYANRDAFEDAVAAIEAKGRVKVGNRTSIPTTVRLRGNTSLGEMEFPKLKLKMKGGDVEDTIFEGAKEVKVGVHGSDKGDNSEGWGRLRSEKAPHREALAYQLMETMGLTLPKTRPARFTYVDTDTGSRTTRNAFLLEDTDMMTKRLGTEVTVDVPQTMPDLIKAYGAEQVALLGMAESLVGNSDWIIEKTPPKAQRAEQDAGEAPPKPQMWNIKSAVGPDGKKLLIPYDFDIASSVSGCYPFAGVIPKAGSDEEQKAIRTQMNGVLDYLLAADRKDLPKAAIAAALAKVRASREAMLGAIDSADVDPEGKRLARLHVETFFKVMEERANGNAPAPTPPAPTPAPATPATVASAFAKIDGSKDGQINREELLGAVLNGHWNKGVMWNIRFVDAFVDQVLRTSDADGDKQLSSAEFTHALRGMGLTAAAEKLMAAADADRDGSLAKIEVPAFGHALGPGGNPEAFTLGFTVFDLLDSDADKKVSRAELDSLLNDLRAQP